MKKSVDATEFMFSADAKLEALLGAYWAMAIVLIENGTLNRDAFFGHLASARDSLERGGEHEAVAALDSIVQPLFERAEAQPAAGK